MNIEVVGEMISPEKNFGLGRVPAFDIRDMKHQMKALLPKKVTGITKKYWWTSGWWGDQGDKPHCVGFACAHFLEDSPVTHPDLLKSSIEDPHEIYRMAQLI